ncbi:FAD-dependent oxidoreductase [Microbacterium indicum]|uniref:FAD-dependent oxidoreductase n=1 Tax=Microbacterium indicum TaxID=358100 RepID=UPI00042510E6|nr:FAD-dependent oxidoreductase [Microbacterium indicum]
MTAPDADVIVVGLGVHGSAAARQLAQRGLSVVGLDRFGSRPDALDHSRGSSHGRTRMIRRAYPNPVWNDLVDRAFRGWADLEAESGQTLIHRTGGMFAHRGDSTLQGPGVRVVERDEAAKLMPSLRMPDGFHGMFDPAAGVLEAERGIAAMRAGAIAAGADLRTGVEVTGWRAEGDIAIVETPRGEIRASRLVLAGGAFLGELVPALASIIEPWRILTATVRPGQSAGQAPGLGVFSIDLPEGLLFGIPDVEGNGLKVGMDIAEPWDPERPPAPVTPSEARRLLDRMAEHVPGIDTSDVDAVSCLYTMTEDKRFIVGALDGAPHVIVASACSGHGFKFGPAIGETIADLCQGVARPDLDFISTSRRGL